jgi:hypothetical protein
MESMSIGWIKENEFFFLLFGIKCCCPANLIKVWVQQKMMSIDVLQLKILIENQHLL